MIKTIGMALFCAAVLVAQDGPEKATVPLHDPSRPARIQAHLISGGIIVRGADVKDVVVEARSRGRDESREHRPARAEGMKRLDLGGNAGLDVVEDNNVVNIKTAPWGSPVDLMITVPRHSSLELKSVNDGNIDVDGVDGEIDADDLNGKIVIKNVAGSVVAHSLNGEVVVTMNRVDPSKPMSFSTMNGNIDVTLPENVKANVRMKTDNGEIYSDFDVKLESGTRMVQNEPGDSHDGKYHVRFDHGLRGTINGGGPEFQFTSFNGQIYIRKTK
jgi:DUF4097 and DUF4098 domain-containing protein YvlB